MTDHERKLLPMTRRDNLIALAYVTLALGGPTLGWMLIIALVKWVVGRLPFGQLLCLLLPY